MATLIKFQNGGRQSDVAQSYTSSGWMYQLNKQDKRLTRECLVLQTDPADGTHALDGSPQTALHAHPAAIQPREGTPATAGGGETREALVMDTAA